MIFLSSILAALIIAAVVGLNACAIREHRRIF